MDDRPAIFDKYPVENLWVIIDSGYDPGYPIGLIYNYLTHRALLIEDNDLAARAVRHLIEAGVKQMSFAEYRTYSADRYLD